MPLPLLACLLAASLVPTGLPVAPRVPTHGITRGGALPAMQELGRRSRRRKRGVAKAERAKGVDTLRLSDLGGGAVPIRKAPFRYLCVLDVEATCERNTKHYIHEIIEFPVVVVDLDEKEVVGEFHTYVRPTVNTTLTEFCTKLTGITQDRVDDAPTLAEALQMFEEWRLEQPFGLVHTPEQQAFAFAADGPWDLRFFLHGECERKGILKPAYFDKWVNVKALFADFYRCRTCKIHRMLEIQNMRFEGRLHSGIDDTRNIARIAKRMAEDGCSFYLNEALSVRDQAASRGAFASL